jgi:hypothetical protein
MTTLARNEPRAYEPGDIEEYGAAVDILYEGAAVGTSSGFGRPLQAGDPFVGFCFEKCDNSAGSAGDKRVKVRERGTIVLAVVGVTGITDVGAPVYASDDDTFTLTASTNSLIGHVARRIAGATCAVEYDATRNRSAAPTTAATTVTNAGTGADFAIQALVQSSGFGFVTAAEGSSVIDVVINNQARIGEVVACLRAHGLMA